MRNLDFTKHASSSLYPLNGLRFIFPLYIAFLLTACPDPSSQYDTFNERRAETLAAREASKAGEEGGMTAGDEGEMMAGEMMAGDMMAGDEMLEPVPQIMSGTFLFGLAPNLNVERPMAFVVDV